MLLLVLEGGGMRAGKELAENPGLETRLRAYP